MLLAVVVALLALLVAGLLRSHAEILRALHALGVDHYLTKPYHPETLLAHIAVELGAATGPRLANALRIG